MQEEGKSGRPALILTVLLLLVAVPFFLFAQLLAFNGVSEHKAVAAIAIWFVGHLILLFFAALFAGKGAQALVFRLHWGRFLSNALATLVATGFGVLASLVMILIACLAMGIK